MAKPRVHEVAKELGLTSKEVLAHLESIGQPVKSHASTIEEALAERVRTELGDGAGEPAAESPGSTAAPTAEAPPSEPDAVRVHRGITVQDFAAKVDRAPGEI